MPYQQFSDGLYLLKRPSLAKGLVHYGLMDVGNRIAHPEVLFPNQPVVIHQTPPQIKMEWLQDTGTWDVHAQVAPEHEGAAIARLKEALKRPDYDLFGNNCEHFARYVVTGERISTQVRAAAFVASLAALAMWN